MQDEGAWQRVRGNKGSPGVDGMTIEETKAYLREHWPNIRSQLLAGWRPRPLGGEAEPRRPDGMDHRQGGDRSGSRLGAPALGTYQPPPVKWVEIPKPDENLEDLGGAPTPSIDLFALLAAVLGRWKLITAITLSAVIAAYGVLKFVPSIYTSTVELLIFDPEQQIDAAVQKPVSPFVDAVGYDAMNTEIEIIKSKSIALRVASELGLDRDPGFLPHNGLAELAKWHGLPRLGRADNNGARAIGATEEEKAKKLDEAADALRERLEVVSENYVISISASSQNPIEAQRLASTIANDYLASEREARQEALERVATWLKGRVDDLHSRLLETESSIEKLKAQSDVRDAGPYDVNQPQIRELNTQLIIARAEVEKRRAGIEQAGRPRDTNQSIQSVISTPSDIQSIPELAASAELTELRQKQLELNWRATQLQDKLGVHHAEVLNMRAQLAGINEQIQAETEHIIGNMTEAYNIALQQEHALEADLRQISAAANSESYVKLEQLRRVADTDRNLYESYLSQYNEISERRTLQDATARIISPATLPRSPSRPRRNLFYALGGILGLGGGFSLALMLEYLRSGVRTSTEIEQSFGRPVVGIIPLVQHRKCRGTHFNITRSGR